MAMQQDAQEKRDKSILTEIKMLFAFDLDQITSERRVSSVIELSCWKRKSREKTSIGAPVEMRCSNVPIHFKGSIDRAFHSHHLFTV